MNHSGKRTMMLWVILGAALVLRITAAPFFKGYPPDISCFGLWAQEVFARGFAGLYRPGYFCDYPPGYMYVLYVVGMLMDLFHTPYRSPGFLLLLKSPPMIVDVVISYWIFRLAVSRLSERAALALTAAYALNPAIILNSTAWGQLDSFLAVLILLVLYFLSDKKYAVASSLFAIAVLVKYQALFIAPFLLVILIASKNWKTIVMSLAIFLIVFLALASPFFIKNGYGSLFQLYYNALKSYPYATLNAFNLHALLGGNGIPVSRKTFLFTFSTWGIILTLSIYLYLIYLSIKGTGKGLFYYCAFQIYFSLFAVCTRMHERYLYPALLLALVTLIYMNDRRFAYLYCSLSLTHFINMAIIYSGAVKEQYWLPPGDRVMLAVSALNLLILVYSIIAGWRIFMTRVILPFDSRAQSSPEAGAEGFETR